MNRPELFVKSVDILVDAFNKGKLANMSVCNCAVGNLIAYRTGTYEMRDTTWHELISEIRDRRLTKKQIETNVKDVTDKVFKGEHSSSIKYMVGDIRKTEYSINEVEKIERAFEKVVDGEYVPQDAFGNKVDVKTGLMRAIKVLGKIHEVPAETVKCMIDHVNKGTYKFSYSFKKPKPSDSFTNDSCPIVKKLKVN